MKFREPTRDDQSAISYGMGSIFGKPKPMYTSEIVIEWFRMTEGYCPIGKV